MDPNAVINRVMRLARLDTTVFDEVRDDVNELIPAMVVAAISVLLAGFGAFLFEQIVPASSFDSSFLNAFILGSIFMFVMYGVAIAVVYVVMAQFYKVQVDLQTLARTCGYAALPLALSVLMFIPLIYPVFALVPLALLFVMMIYAVQSATGADSNQVVVSVLIGFTVMVLVLGAIAVSTSLGKAPMGAGVFGLLFRLS
ncbi:MAG: YIP1 family protein [Tepidiformaceae bacterium]